MKLDTALKTELGDIVRLRNTQTYGFVKEKIVTKPNGVTCVDFLVCTEEEDTWKGYKQVCEVVCPDDAKPVEVDAEWVEPKECAEFFSYLVMGRFYMCVKTKIKTNLCYVMECGNGELLSADGGNDGIALPPYKDRITETAAKIAKLINARCGEWLQCFQRMTLRDLASRKIRTEEDFDELFADAIMLYKERGYAVSRCSRSAEKYGDDVSEMTDSANTATICSHRGYTSLSNINPDVRTLTITENGTDIVQRKFYICNDEKSAMCGIYSETASQCETMANVKKSSCPRHDA